MQSLRLAVENPPGPGEYRVFNQFDAAYSVNALAETVRQIASEFGLAAEIAHPPNPRVEAEEHSYEPEHERLKALGYRRTRELADVLREIFHDLLRFRRRLQARRHVVAPAVDWRRGDNRAELSHRARPVGSSPAPSGSVSPTSPDSAPSAPSGPVPPPPPPTL